jgi:anti-sigma factor RsiW
MACPEFTDLLVDYHELDNDQRQVVDAHISSCTECQTFHSALIEVDSTLTATFAGLEAPANLRQEVMSQTPLRPPSFVPLILDLTGGVAVLMVTLVLLDVYAARLPVNIPTNWVAAAMLAAGALVVGYRSYADLKN